MRKSQLYTNKFETDLDYYERRYTYGIIEHYVPSLSETSLDYSGIRPFPANNQNIARNVDDLVLQRRREDEDIRLYLSNNIKHRPPLCEPVDLPTKFLYSNNHPVREVIVPVPEQPNAVVPEQPRETKVNPRLKPFYDMFGLINRMKIT